MIKPENNMEVKSVLYFRICILLFIAGYYQRKYIFKRSYLLQKNLFFYIIWKYQKLPVYFVEFVLTSPCKSKDVWYCFHILVPLEFGILLEN